MQVIKYLKENGLDKLKEEFGINVRQYDDGLMVLNYHQLNSPSSHPIVKECRSLILDKNFNVVSRSFDRFFNLNEKPDSIVKSFSPDMSLFEKLDGSIINIYFYNGKWNFGSKSAAFGEFGTINSPKTFKDLVLESLNLTEEEFQLKSVSLLDKRFTYICELTGQENKVIKEYSKKTLNILSVRDNATGNYISDKTVFDNLLTFGIDKPKKYEINSLEDIYSNLKKLSGFDEGFVLYIGGKPIAKIKTLAYVTLSLMKGEQGFTKQNLIKMVLSGESSEFLTYFPDYSSEVKLIQDNLVNLKQSIIDLWNKFKDIEDKNVFAKSIVAEDQTIKSILFMAKKQMTNNIELFFEDSIKKDLKIKYLLQFK